MHFSTSPAQQRCSLVRFLATHRRALPGRTTSTYHRRAPWWKRVAGGVPLRNCWHQRCIIYIYILYVYTYIYIYIYVDVDVYVYDCIVLLLMIYCLCIWLYSIITDDILYIYIYITYVCYHHGQTKYQHMRQKIKSIFLAWTSNKYQCLQNKT